VFVVFVVKYFVFKDLIFAGLMIMGRRLVFMMGAPLLVRCGISGTSRRRGGSDRKASDASDIHQYDNIRQVIRFKLGDFPSKTHEGPRKMPTKDSGSSGATFHIGDGASSSTKGPRVKLLQ
jgi:hypothetical protein